MIHNRLFRCVLLVLIFLLLVSTGFAQEKPSGDKAKSYIAYLASDELHGRDTGTPYFEKAAQYVANKFKEWGLEPAGDDGTYFQNFPFSYYEAEFDYPELKIGGRKFYYQDGDFRLLRYSGGGKIKGEVVFVGYGISAPDKNFDEYKNIDVKGKIVLLMHGIPNDDEDEWGDFKSDSVKVDIARNHGATGALICAKIGDRERKIGYWRLRPGNYRDGFVVYGVDERVANFLLRKKNEGSRSLRSRLRRLQQKLDKDKTPISFATGKKAQMKVKVEYDPKRMGKNVLGVIRGTDPKLKDEVIVLGAHLDHIGVNYHQIHNGADDNASGSSLVMELARVMKKNNIQPKRTILFACWGGEERGLLGSRYYGEHPKFPIEKTVLNFNMDMVGLGKKLGIPGKYYAPHVWELIKKNNSEETLDFLKPGRGGPGGSDHTPFITRGVPAFALMTSPWGDHPDYHQPGDDTEKIDAELLEKVARFVYDNTLFFANYTGNLIKENRHALYIHKSALVTNFNPLPYEKGLAILDSLENEWVDVQFFDISLDSLKAPSEKLFALFKTIFQAFNEQANPFRNQFAVFRMFGRRQENPIPVVGLHGVESVAADVDNLAIAAKLGAKYFTFDGFDGKWINEKDGLTSEGKKAIRTARKNKMMVIVQNLPENVLIEILEASRNPVIVAGRFNPDSLSSEFLDAVKENEAVLALGFCPMKETEQVAESLVKLNENIGSSHLALYLGLGHQINYHHLDKLFNVTIALKDKGLSENQIKNILSGNLRRIFMKINPPQDDNMRRMMRFF